MPTNLLKRLLMKTTSLFPGKDRTLVPLKCRRSQSNLFQLTSRTLYTFTLLITFTFALTTNGMKMERKSDNLEPTTLDQRKDSEQTMFMTAQCKKCARLHRLSSLRFDSDLSRETTARFSARLLEKLVLKPDLNCDHATHRRCEVHLHRLRNNEELAFGRNWKQTSDDELVKIELNEKQKNMQTISTSSNDDVVTVSPTLSVLRRQKRLAEGDRRLIHFYCYTGYYLEIHENGKVVGSRIKSDNNILEMQSVKSGGIVRFYSPHTKMYLAMNKFGFLYATNNYNEQNCDFVEHINDVRFGFNTYFASNYPRSSRAKSKRSALRHWYVGIGRRGFARKANRIRPNQSSAQFIPFFV